MTPFLLHQQPSDKILNEVARRSVCSVLELGIQLGLEQCDVVNRLPAELPLERKIELLLLWKRQKGHYASNDILLTALYQCGSDTSLLQTVIDIILYENTSDEGNDGGRVAMAEYDGPRSNHDDLKNGNNSLKNDHNDLKSDYDCLKSDYDCLKSDYDDLKSDHDDLKSDHGGLKSDYDDLKSEFDCLKGVYDGLKIENKRLKGMQCIEQDRHLDSDAEQCRGVPSPDKVADRPVVINWESEIFSSSFPEELTDCSQKSEHSSTYCASPNTPTLVNSLDMENRFFGFLPAGSKRSFSQSDES